MRSIPFDVVCLIGMNDESFPRRQPKQGFDLLSYDFRKGDRSRRDDDRYLFLEAILSAKKHLYMSYIGASIVDNTAIPPSVLVSDVRDVLKQSYETTAGEDIWSVIHTEHPLQSFSRRYFNGYNAKLFSYQQASCPPSEKVSDKAWFVDSLPEPDESWRTVSLTQLMQFYRHPARYLIQQRLGLRLELEDESLECRESFELGGLEAWQVRQQVLSQRLQGEGLTDIEPMIMATGILPQGLVGEKSLKAQIGQVDEFVDRLMPAYPETIFEPVPFELKLGEFNLVGLLDGFGADGLFNYRLSKLKGGELIAVWLRHLVLNLLQPEGVKLETRLITQDSDVHLLPVTAAENLLLSLLELYWQGCQSPLPLFANTSFSFAKASLNEGKADPEKAMWASWLGGDYANAESEDSYYQQLYLNPPLDDEFKLLALELYQPIYDHLAGGRL